MAQRKTLTETQVEVLRWIADGCPEGVMADDFHRISAAALRRRGLVTTSGRGASWKAKVTKAGGEYLRKVDGPVPPVPRQANVSVTQQLVDDVIAAGGTLRVPGHTAYGRDRIDYEGRARMAMVHRKVPDGKRLTVSWVGQELDIRLVDAPADEPAELAAIDVPAKVTRYHPAARAFRDGTGRHEISRDQVSRATKIIHTIAVEAERRGWSASVPEGSQDGYGHQAWTGAKDGHLRIEARGQEFWLRLQEDGIRTRGVWEAEVERYRHVSLGDSWYRDRKIARGPYDAQPSGQLKLELFCREYWIYRGRQSRWADRQSWNLERRLPHLFREIDERIVDAERVAEEKRIEAERAAEAGRRAAVERERQWHAIMEQAKARLIEENRVEVLRAQADAWHEAERLRRYCDEAEAEHGGDARTVEWLAWARGYADRLDPLADPPMMPDPQKVTPEALQKHLPKGWSAQGPGRRN